jgi:hypothetical protein
LTSRTAARERDERDQPDHEEAPPPEDVARTAAKQQEAPERERVAAHDPLQVRRREVKGRLNRRECDVRDRHVEDDHQVRHAQDGERLPTPRIGSDTSVHLGAPVLFAAGTWKRCLALLIT